MALNLGDTLTATDCHGNVVSGTVINFLENTVIMEAAMSLHVIRKKELALQGYTFPKYKKNKPYSTTITPK